MTETQLSARRLRKQAEKLELVETTKAELELAGRAYHEAIAEADRAGVPVTAIAEAASLSRPRIYQILKREEENDREA